MLEWQEKNLLREAWGSLKGAGCFINCRLRLGGA
jgi:hypothetical protein